MTSGQMENQVQAAVMMMVTGCYTIHDHGENAGLEPLINFAIKRDVIVNLRISFTYLL